MLQIKISIWFFYWNETNICLKGNNNHRKKNPFPQVYL